MKREGRLEDEHTERPTRARKDGNPFDVAHFLVEDQSFACIIARSRRWDQEAPHQNLAHRGSPIH